MITGSKQVKLIKYLILANWGCLADYVLLFIMRQFNLMIRLGFFMIDIIGFFSHSIKFIIFLYFILLFIGLKWVIVCFMVI